MQYFYSDFIAVLTLMYIDIFLINVMKPVRAAMNITFYSRTQNTKLPSHKGQCIILYFAIIYKSEIVQSV